MQEWGALQYARPGSIAVHLRLGNAALGSIHQGRDGHLQLLLIVALPEQLFLQTTHPPLVNRPGRC